MSSSASNSPLAEAIVITGIGMVTPLGADALSVLARVEAGDVAHGAPSGFDARAFACPVCATIGDFQPRDYIVETKLIRLMSREAQLAVAAAHLALQDAALRPDSCLAPEEIGLFGATGLAGLPVREILPMLQASTDTDGCFDLEKFGESGLRAVSPILSFKILSNMPVCFVSICENIQGPNAVYTPWEGHGARAMEAGILALQSGDARCVLVGGCDVKTHELAFLALEQLGLFESWKRSGSGPVPGEGAVFLVLETEATARSRQARVHARLAEWSFQCRRGEPQVAVLEEVIRGVDHQQAGSVIAAANADPALDRVEAGALARVGASGLPTWSPKKQLGDLFAAAAPLQVALGALAAKQSGKPVLADCFGHGTEQAAFLLQPR